MLISEWLEKAEKKLTSKKILTARLDASIFLQDHLKKNSAWVLAHQDYILNIDDLKKLNHQISLRENNIPVAYIRNKVEFYNREFYVDNRVLIPRPESESIIDILKSLTLKKCTIADLGTGSGALGITIFLENPNLNVELLENDDQALEVARKNLELKKLDLRLIKSDMLSQSSSKYKVIAANLPYVPKKFPISESAKMEPYQAIFSNDDGLGHYKKLWTQLLNSDNKPKHVLTESFPFQHKSMLEVAQKSGYNLFCVDNFVQCFRRIN